MTVIRKTLLRCDVCKKTVEAPDDVASLGIRFSSPGCEHLRGWTAAEGGHHLCPECAKPYLAKKAEMERELKALSGVETVEIDL